MCEDVIQIGPWPLCAGWLIALLPLAGTLIALVGTVIGVILGGIISYGTALIIENRRTVRERQEEDRRLARELQDQRRTEAREALQEALKWFSPLMVARRQAHSTSDAYVRAQIDESQFRKKYPKKIRADMAKYDLPSHLILHLPVEAYQRITMIIFRFEDLFNLALRERGNGEQAYQEVNALSEQIRDDIRELQMELKAEYNKTFE